MPNERSQVHTTEFLRGTDWINKRAMASGGNVSFSLKFQNGDLFDCPKTDSLAHCVSRDLKMGKGIAVIFKKKFGQVDSLKHQGKKVGEVAYIEKDGRYIYYLITKEKANDKPTYDDLKKSLQYMKKHCVFAKVAHLSMPRIGCGLDRLEWSEVEQILRDIFGNMNITITIYDLPQKEAEVKHDEKSHPNGDEKACPKDEMVSSKYVKALKADEKNPCIEDEKASLRKDEVPPKRNENAPSKEDEKGPYKGDEKLSLKRDENALSKGDEKPSSKRDEKVLSKGDEKPPSKRDEKVLSKGDEKPSSKRDEKPSSKRDEKPSSKRDEKVPSKKGEKAPPEGKT